MEELLSNLGLQDKEIKIYLGLLEIGLSPASVLAKKISLPKSTTLFHLENLTKSGIIQKSQKGKTQYFYADPEFLQKNQQEKIDKKQDALKNLIPLLNEHKSPFTSRPQIEFFEGIESCKKCYQDLLSTKTEILEFGAHEDLEAKFGKNFMDNFIATRKKKKIFLKAIASDNPVERALKNHDQDQCRDIKIFPKNFGKLFSSIAIYEDKVLILNLFHDAFAIRIKNEEFSSTMRTIFSLLYS